MPVEPPAVAFSSTSTVVGLHWASAASTAVSFAGTAPLTGNIQLEGVFFAVRSGPGLEDPHRLQLAIATNVPGNQAALDAGVQIFPRAGQTPGIESALLLTLLNGGMYFPVSTVINVDGMRIVGGFYNASGSVQDLYVPIVLRGVAGGDVGALPTFLQGPVVEEL